jgi:hypothetical protein
MISKKVTKTTGNLLPLSSDKKELNQMINKKTDLNHHTVEQSHQRHLKIDYRVQMQILQPKEVLLIMGNLD